MQGCALLGRLWKARQSMLVIPAAILWPRLVLASASTKVHDVHLISPMQLSSLQVSRAVRRATVTDAIDTGSVWSSQLLSALQQRGYIASAGASDRPPAFVFDIDGVLIRGSRVLEPAKKALARLYENGGMGFLLCKGTFSSRHFSNHVTAFHKAYLVIT